MVRTNEEQDGIPELVLNEAEEAALSADSFQTRDGFLPGSIHLPDKVEFWRNELKASDWVMDTLRQGYMLPLESPPPTKYEEDNNKSARTNMEFVRETVQKWERQGVVKFVKQKPQIVSPLSVVERQQASGISKKRLCWDGSRCINKLLKKQRVTLAHLQKALEITEQGDLQLIFTLESTKSIGPSWELNSQTKKVIVSISFFVICPLD